MKSKTKNPDKTKQRIFTYLAIVFGIYYITWVVALLSPADVATNIYSILQFPLIFMGTPALAMYITRKITKDDTPMNFSTKVRKNKKMLLFSALVPTAAIFLGIILFYIIFPNDLDYSGKYITENFSAYGAPTDISFTIPSLLIMGVIVSIISAIAVPIWFIALGEDIGWQGYLLPLLCKKLPIRGAALITGTLWGLAHAPLIYAGFNYGTDYAGAPFTGIAMMVLACIVIGMWLSYVTLKSKNCMYAAVIHGAVDIIGEAGIWVSLSTKSILLGPNPTGIIGMSFLLIGAIIIFIKLPKLKTE